MTEEKFWRSTPRQLIALLEVHLEVSPNYDTGKKSKKELPTGFIDQVGF